jgi:PAS domain S-box-containing protein
MSQRTVLIIDDSPEDREVYRRYLLKDIEYDYTILEANLGRDGLVQWQQSQPDAVLLDYRLPDLDGLEVLAAWQGLTHQTFCPAIMITGQGDLEIAIQAIKAGAQDYLVKEQLSPEGLYLAINTAIEAVRLRTQLQQSLDRERQAREKLELRVQERTAELQQANLHLKQEIEERKHVEADLERLSTALSHAMEGISQLDLHGRYIQVNQAYAAMVGYTPEAMIGMDWQQTVHPDDLETLRLAYQHMLDHGKVEVDARGIRKDSSVFYKQLVMVTAYDSQLQMTGHYCFMKDISDRKQAEAELQAQTQELARSNAELQQFAYVASHDLQEPLRMITSYLELLERRYRGQLDPSADKFIAYAVDGAVRMQTLIQDLLSYSRVGTRGQRFTKLDCATIVNTAIKNLQVSIAQSNAVITQDKMPEVYGDSTQLVQLFQNLLSNAIKFRRDIPPHIQIRVEKTRDEWLFSVCDNGIGIESQYADRIFLIFQRLHSRTEYPGTGIGLAICKKIVERHGGNLWLESKVGQGSCFYFTLSTQDSRPLTHRES